MKKNGDKPEILIQSEKIVNDYAKKLLSVEKEKNKLSLMPLYVMISAATAVGGIIFFILK